MKQSISIHELGSWLLTYIKKHPKHTLGKTSSATLNITYGNFQKRLAKNNIKLAELQKILDYLELEINISIGDTEFRSDQEEYIAPPPVDYEKLIQQNERVIKLQEKVISLQEKLQQQQEND